MVFFVPVLTPLVADAVVWSLVLTTRNGLVDSVIHAIFGVQGPEWPSAPQWAMPSTVPLLSPSLFFGIVLTVITSFQVFDLVYVLTDGGPGTSSTTIVCWLFEKGFNDYAMGTPQPSPGCCSSSSWLSPGYRCGYNVAGCSTSHEHVRQALRPTVPAEAGHLEHGPGHCRAPAAPATALGHRFQRPWP